MKTISAFAAFVSFGSITAAPQTKTNEGIHAACAQQLSEQIYAACIQQLRARQSLPTPRLPIVPSC